MATKLIWIYLMRDKATGFYKIGKSSDPSTRLTQLCRQDTKQPTPNDFELIEAWWTHETDERKMHWRFSAKRRRGEWFELDQNDLQDVHAYFAARQVYSALTRPGTTESQLHAAQETINQLRYQVSALQTEVADLKGAMFRLQEMHASEKRALYSDAEEKIVRLIENNQRLSEQVSQREHSAPKTGRLEGLPRLKSLKRDE